MTLSFREQAAIANASHPFSVGGHTSVWLTNDRAVAMAQELADECCKAWGHDWYYVRDEEKPHCKRCEQEVEPPPELPIDPGPSHAYRVAVEKHARELQAAIEAAQVERDAARNVLADILDALGVEFPQEAKLEILRLKAREP